MRSVASQAEIDQYRENGFVVIEDFLNPQELEVWTKHVVDACDDRLNAAKPKEGEPWLTNAGNSSEYYQQVFLQCIKLADTHEGVRKLMLDPALGEFVASIAGIDGIRIWHDQALFKPAFGNPTGWHLDNPYWSFFSRDAISIWVALDDATLSNGCLYYLPGTQRTARFENSNIGENIGDLFKVYPEWKEIDTVATPCRAGSAVLHNGLTAHGAGANMTNKSRRAMTCAYMPDGSTFNGQQNVLPTEYSQTLKLGQVLDDDKMNPLVWRR
jgi:ectoine hydroxylase-related dioxygenase (phytanoyl-CoA dioxygenase family)